MIGMISINLPNLFLTDPIPIPNLISTDPIPNLHLPFT